MRFRDEWAAGPESRPRQVSGKAHGRVSNMRSAHVIPVAALLLAMITPASAAGPADAPPGALACSGCHATARSVETTVPRLIGRNPAALAPAMQASKSGQLPPTVLHRVAQRSSDDEVRALAARYGPHTA